MVSAFCTQLQGFASLNQAAQQELPGKRFEPQEVYDAIIAACHKGAYINERTLKAVQRRMTKKIKPRKPDVQITRREEEILQLVCQQCTAEEIAAKLFISVKTVNGHRNNLLQKQVPVT